MAKIFNVTGVCIPKLHYMVDLTGRLQAIRVMVERGDYFTINRARQYGKTTTLHALTSYLQDEYLVVNLDFQVFSTETFSTEAAFAAALSRWILRDIRGKDIPDPIRARLQSFSSRALPYVSLDELFLVFGDWCAQSEKPIVLIIDEVDTASNYQVFLDFLAQLRSSYLRRSREPAFRSVILAGVYDIKNLKRKIVSEGTHQTNSPWNIAAEYSIDMGFSSEDIAGMLEEYEEDYHSGMDIRSVASLIYDYTAGYPFLVSRICKLLDEQIAGNMPEFPDRTSAWTKQGVLEAVRRLITEKNTLFESLTDKIQAYPQLRKMLCSLLMDGTTISYNPDDTSVDIAIMFGFVRVEDARVVVANRIFETRLYNMFLTSPEMIESEMYRSGDRDKSQFIRGGILDMRRILEQFVLSFHEIYGDTPEDFLEEDGRRYFLLYLRPIINGTGNYYIEAQTRNQERTDVVVDYRGRQYIIEMKIWHGDAYNKRGEEQLADYLDYYHLDRGYMLSFNFNKKKESGVRELQIGDKVLVEAVV